MLPRFFVDIPLEKGAIVFLSEDEKKHLKVLRMQEKDHVEIINGKNYLAQGILLPFIKKEVSIEITSVIKKKPKLWKIYLIQSYTKPTKLDFILEKGCELGVDSFIFFPSKKGEKPNMKKLRHQSLLIASIKQCRRVDLPEILYTEKGFFPEKTHLFFGDLRKNAPFFPSIFRNLQEKKSIGFINGPEAGFTEEEVTFFANTIQAKGVSLHPHILRTETAALSACVFCQMYVNTINL